MLTNISAAVELLVTGKVFDNEMLLLSAQAMCEHLNLMFPALVAIVTIKQNCFPENLLSRGRTVVESLQILPSITLEAELCH